VTGPVGLGIILGLVVGAPVFGLALAWVAVRFSGARLSDGLDWGAIAALAPLKGIGFTVAIFIALLAFDDAATQEEAKLAILVGSALSAAVGATALTIRGRRGAGR
jgi:Na+:H+ antiporter, NhaA family